LNFLQELKRRNVVRVGIAYVVASWLLVQAADLILDLMGAPDLVLRSLAVLLALGFIPAVIFAWAFEMTPEGIRKESEVDRTASTTQVTAKKLDLITIGLLVTVIALVLVDRYLPGQAENGSEQLASEEADSLSATDDRAVPPVEKSIAVLPFTNRSNSDDDLFFTDGIHDDLLTQLAKIHKLKVISRTSVMEYRGTTKNMKDIGAELGVSTILEGGIQKVGNRVRINTQLIDVETDQHLWAETFDRELTAENIFDIQSEIAQEVVRAVTIELTPEELESLTIVPTQNLEAYESFLRGREIYYGVNYSAEKERRSRPWLEKAVQLDPDYVEALALLSQLYGQLLWRGIDTSPAMLEKYRAILDRAKMLNSRSPSVLLASANYLYRVEYDYAQSLILIEEALQIAPGNSEAWSDRGSSLRRLGRWDEAIESYRKSLELDPANRSNKALMVETMESIHDWEAILASTVSLEDARPDEMDIQLSRARAQYQLNGDIEPIKRALASMNLEGSTDYLVTSAWVHMMDRNPEAAIETLNNPIWMQMASYGNLQNFRLYQLAEAWLLNGTEDMAMKYFEVIVNSMEETLNSTIQVQCYGGMQTAISLARLGRLEEALALSEKLTSEIPYERDAMLWGWMMERQALVRGLAGDKKKAVEELRLALNTATALGSTAWDLHYNPIWDFMRDDPGFQELATPANLIRTQIN
jgi:TolB-like protein